MVAIWARSASILAGYAGNRATGISLYSADIDADGRRL